MMRWIGAIVLMVVLAGSTATGEESFEYRAGGRRDPFTRTAEEEPERTGPGVAGMRIAELDLMGIVISADGERFAIVMGSDDRGYHLRIGDDLWDGRVKGIEADRVLFLQRVEEALDPREFREVVKTL